MRGGAIGNTSRSGREILGSSPSPAARRRYQNLFKFINNMEKRTPTKYAQLLIDALKERGIKSDPEYFDGHKTVDIAVHDAKIFIEIDGLHHYTQSEQIKADFRRNHFSDGDDIDTIRIPNELINNHLKEIADGVAGVIKGRLNNFSTTKTYKIGSYIVQEVQQGVKTYG